MYLYQVAVLDRCKLRVSVPPLAGLSFLLAAVQLPPDWQLVAQLVAPLVAPLVAVILFRSLQGAGRRAELPSQLSLCSPAEKRKKYID